MGARCLIVVDRHNVPAGSIAVGGTALLRDNPTDEEIGFAATAAILRVHDDDQARQIGEMLIAEGVEVKDAYTDG